MKSFKKVENKEGFKVQLGKYIFRISTFCFKKIGDTENMKVRLACEGHEDLGGDFDDFESLKIYLNKFMQEELFDYMIMSV